MRVKYIKMISYLSLIFLTANFILCISNLKCINGYTFLWMLIIMAVVCSEVHISNILRVACCVLTFVPIFFEPGLSYKVSVAIVGAVLTYFHRKFALEINYDQALYQLKAAFTAIIIMIAFSYLAADSVIVNEYIIPYAILFIIFDIMLLRTMRNYKYNTVNKKLRKINMFYLIFVVVFSAVLSIKEIRSVAKAGAVMVYNGISFILGKICLFFSCILFKLLPQFHIKQETVDKFYKNFQLIYGKRNQNQDLNEGLKRIQPILALQSFIVKAIIVIIVVSLFLYMFKMQYNRKKETSDFVEKREAIKSDEHKGKHRLSIYDKLKKGSYKDKIRYYYYKLLLDCSKKNIKIACSDTTKEINNKAGESFNKECLNNMRDIYIKAKYTESECTAEDYNSFHKNYKEK